MVAPLRGLELPEGNTADPTARTPNFEQELEDAIISPFSSHTT